MPRIPQHDDLADDEEILFDRNDDYGELDFSLDEYDDFEEDEEFDDSEFYDQEEDC